MALHNNINMLLITIFIFVTSHDLLFAPSLGLTLHGINIDTVSLNGSVHLRTPEANRFLRTKLYTLDVNVCLVELQCDTGGRSVVSRSVRTDYLGRFDFFFKTVEVPEFNPLSCEVAVGVGGAKEVLRASIREETIAQTIEGAQAFFHASHFKYWIGSAEL
ncbi:hypothetical protein Syun_026630 [Stephania yunnanensis]|uniref:Uncharacterized protein n=1 Tax=Stephania yunnanensis TaxID=152371 RepID=A0AAP0HX66_9MAGN